MVGSVYSLHFCFNTSSLFELCMQAALSGVIMSIACMTYIVVGSWGRNHYDTLVTSTENCPGLNATTIAPPLLLMNETTASKLDEGFNILDLSFNWYTVIGFLITWLVGCSLSYLLSPGEDAKYDPNLLSPVIHTFVHYEQTPSEELPVLKIEKLKEQI